GLLCRILSLTWLTSWVPLFCPETAAMYSITFFAPSVLPAPLSPETRMHWDTLFESRSRYAAAGIKHWTHTTCTHAYIRMSQSPATSESNYTLPYEIPSIAKHLTARI